ncbi:5-oxoprolinase subunit B family protein [Aestuariimicrobium soli]|uniref:5-oxoprolinase subunit B family protein n=1 Tax=Aestuariimicrobium soli TaxID=2035834 RepID=UPI003EB98EED
MKVDLRRLGLTGLLVDCGSAPARRAFAAALDARIDEFPGVLEVVPAACTVAVLVDSEQRIAPLRDWLVELAREAEPAHEGEGEQYPPASRGRGVDLVVPVTYDGVDLAAVGDLLDLTPAEVVAWHTGQVWTCDVTGFMPGFGYLTGEHPREVPRLASPRPRIPAGSVALAGVWTGIYPGESPGGWQLIGRTDLAMFDPTRSRPALLAPGTRLRFESVGRGAGG